MVLSEERRAEMARKGAVETTVQELFGLDDADMQVIEFQLRVAREVKRRRLAAKMSQKVLAARLEVSQPRIPVIEAGSSEASLETVLRAYFATGGTLAGLAGVVEGRDDTTINCRT